MRFYKWMIVFFYCTTFQVFTDPFSDWIDRVAERELSFHHKHGISQKSLDDAWRTLCKKAEFHRYKVVDSIVYGPESRIKNLLRELIKTGPVPNVDFIYYYEDRIKKSFAEKEREACSNPIFVSAKDRALPQFVLFSDWLYDPTNDLSGWNAICREIETSIPVSWGVRQEILFWRGSAFDGKHFGMYDFSNWTFLPRGQLVFQSRRHPSWINAAFSSYPDKCLASDPERCLAEMGPAEFVPISEQLKYKYHILIDGVTCTYPATHWKMLSGSAIFKQDSSEIMYFYPDLIAWQHYIPVRRDLSDLFIRLNWARTHDEEVQKIAHNARRFAKERLMPEHILAYCRAVLFRYAQLQRFAVTVGPDDLP